jgi:PEGA domain
VEVRLAAQASPERGRSPASGGGPPPAAAAATTGALEVASLPAGAAVTLDGKPIGVTPLTLPQLAPGDYRVTMRLKGFQTVETTVRVVAGERARAAARLTEQEQE